MNEREQISKENNSKMEYYDSVIGSNDYIKVYIKKLKKV